MNIDLQLQSNRVCYLHSFLLCSIVHKSVQWQNNDGGELYGRYLGCYKLSALTLVAIECVLFIQVLNVEVVFEYCRNELRILGCWVEWQDVIKDLLFFVGFGLAFPAAELTSSSVEKYSLKFRREV